MKRGQGKAVIDGVLQYVSPSQITTFRDCERRWWREKVGGIWGPPSDAMDLGTTIHDVLEGMARSGICDPQSSKLTDKQFATVRKAFDLGYGAAPVAFVEIEINPPAITLAGIPVTGFIDLLFGPIVDRNGLKIEPPEVLDWKSKSDMRTCLTEGQLPRDTQMAIYGAWACRKFDSSTVRLTHVNIPTRAGEPVKVSAVVEACAFDPILLSLSGIVERMKQVAALPDDSSLRCTCSWKDKCPPQLRKPKPALLERMTLPENPVTLYINAIPEKGVLAWTLLDDLIAQRTAPILARAGVGDLRLMKYATGKGELAKSFREDPPEGIIVAWSGDIADAVIEVLAALPNAVVIRGGVR